MVGLLAMAGFVIDVGHGYRAKRTLQATADAAALAGGQELPNAAAAEAYARAFGSTPSNKNFVNWMETTETLTTRCIASIPGCSPVNAIVVEEKAKVDTVFLKVLGIDHFNIRAKATACSPCGVKPLDVMLVLDRTGSMCQDSNGNSDPSCTDLNNAKDGLRTFLSIMNPEKQWVGLAVLPPSTSISSRCSTPPSSNNYNYDLKSAAYTIVPLSKDYRLTNGSLNSGSDLVKTVNCVKGAGVTAYANAIESAQAELDKSGRPEVQDVIIFMSDGAANTGPSWASSSYRTTPCRQGVKSSGYSKTKGTIVYSIGYALDDDTGGCTANNFGGPPEKPYISVYDAMSGIASPGNFYNKPNPGQLNTIYAQIAADIRRGTSGLIADEAQ
jgi:putative Flp pilus-assembly TadE/G-like protein